jgi:DNA mismatch endonuclease (patch repair protein)
MGYLRDGRAPIPLSEATSRVMSANKAKNTKPELTLRSELTKVGLRGYRVHLKILPGRPDIVFTKYKLAIFVNGCFWHRCLHCSPPKPKTNQDFWNDKFGRNQSRDLAKISALEALDWKVLTIWECEIKGNIENVINKVKTSIESTSLLG